jgi:hypothetical protein
MTQGAMIFALGRGAIDYVALARWSARRIQHWWQLPVTVVTDQSLDRTGFDHVIEIETTETGATRWFEDLDGHVAWRNHDRCDAWHLSPYDRTVLVDADFVVASDGLRPIIALDRFWCYQRAVAVGAGYQFDTFGQHRHPLAWATVMAFGRDSESRYIFDAMRMIRDNWSHYRDLYHVDSRLFRNDFALSMALPLVNGHVQPELPRAGAMLNVLPEQRLRQQGPDQFEVDFRNSRGVLMRCVLDGQDFHAMCKSDLGEIVAAH